jgi:hypothetical protein
MPRPFIDMAGRTFGRLLIGRYSRNSPSGYWEAICSCGSACVVAGHNVRAGRTRSCGCGEVENRTAWQARIAAMRRGCHAHLRREPEPLSFSGVHLLRVLANPRGCEGSPERSPSGLLPRSGKGVPQHPPRA